MTAADQIRALADTGTPADRWRIRQGRGGSNWIEAGEYDEVLQPAPVTCMAYCYGGSSQIELSDEDAAKIVAAVNALPHIADLIDAIERHQYQSSQNQLWCDICGDLGVAPCDAVTAARDALVAALGVTPPSATTEVWECGPHTNAWNGHDARCRRIRREDVTP